jgi:hypothetical protein
MQVVDRFTVNAVKSWRTSRVVAAIAVVTFVVLQLWMPLSRLGAHDTAPRFGWQMFSTAREAPEFVVETGTGSQEISLNDFMAGARGDVDIERLMPPHLCVVFPDAIVVTWPSGEYRC